MQTYAGGRLPICHFDTYRLGDVDEFLAIGAEEYFESSDFVCVIEWAERVQPVLPLDRLSIRIEQTGESERSFRLTAGGTMSQQLLDRVTEGVTE